MEYRNKIFNDDCMNILKQMPDESVDLVITDPPYKIIAGGVRVIEEWSKDYNEIDNKWVLNRWRIVVSDWSKIWNKWLRKDLNIPSAVKDWKMFVNNDIWFDEWLPEVYRVLKKWTHCYIIINWRNLNELMNVAKKVWFHWQNLLVWNKQNATPNKYYMNAVEFILFLAKKPCRNINDMGTKNIFNIKNIIGKKQHPTYKPLELMEIFVKNSSNEWDLVLDPFAGVGSVCQAARFNNRDFVWIEIDKEFYDKMNKRLLLNRIMDNHFEHWEDVDELIEKWLDWIFDF